MTTPYRDPIRPLISYVKDLHRANPRTVIMVFIPEYVVTQWWQQLLHNQSALRFKARLLFTPGVVVVSVPYHLGVGEDGWMGPPPPRTPARDNLTATPRTAVTPRCPHVRGSGLDRPAPLYDGPPTPATSSSRVDLKIIRDVSGIGWSAIVTNLDRSARDLPMTLLHLHFGLVRVAHGNRSGAAGCTRQGPIREEILAVRVGGRSRRGIRRLDDYIRVMKAA